MDNDGLEGWEGEKVERGTDGKKWEAVMNTMVILVRIMLI